MTREEAKEKVQILDYAETFGEDWVNEKQVIELIDFIYDDIESRVCENCKHVSIQEVLNNFEERKVIDSYLTCDIRCDCQIGGIRTEADFGCNKFELESK